MTKLKLSDSAVRWIRNVWVPHVWVRHYQRGDMKKLAKHYRVSVSYISDIVAGKRRRKVSDWPEP